MFKPVSNKIIFATLFAALSLVACDKSEDESGSSGAYASADSLLNYVPADSPYVMATIAPLPDDVYDKLEPKLDRLLQSYQKLLHEVVAMTAASAKEKGGDSEEAARAVAVLGELSSLLSMEGLRDAGFGRESTAVVYGNGLLPVLRVELSDGALFEAALTRIEEKAGEKMSVTSISGNPVRYLDTKDIKVLVAIMDKQVAISLAPSDFADDELARLLGFAAPDSTIAAAGVLQGIARDYRFNDYFVGYVDFETIVETFTGDASGLDAALLASLDQQDELSDVCRAEVRALAAIAPRMVMGYTGLSTERIDSQIVLEMRDDIAAGLAKLPAAVPGLGGDMGGMMSFGISMDVKAMRQFYEAQLDALDAEPFECPQFGAIQAGVAQGRAMLEQPTPPMVYDFRGFVGVIQNIEGLDLATQSPPTSVDGQFLLAMNNAPALVSLGAMMSPELASLGLEANGKAVRVDLPEAQMLGGNVFMAMTDDAVAMSIGQGAEAQLGSVLSAKPTDNGTFMNFSMDAGRYYKFIGEAIAASEDDSDTPMSPGMQAAMQEMMLAAAGFYDRMSMDMRFTDKGLVIDSSVTLGD